MWYILEMKVHACFIKLALCTKSISGNYKLKLKLLNDGNQLFFEKGALVLCLTLSNTGFFLGCLYVVVQFVLEPVYYFSN